MGHGQASHWSWSACPSICTLSGTWPLSVAWRAGHPSLRPLPPSHTGPSCPRCWPRGHCRQASLAGLSSHRLVRLECGVQPVKPSVPRREFSSGVCFQDRFSRVFSERPFCVYRLESWCHGALGKTVPGDLSSSAQEVAHTAPLPTAAQPWNCPPRAASWARHTALGGSGS